MSRKIEFNVKMEQAHWPFVKWGSWPNLATGQSVCSIVRQFILYSIFTSTVRQQRRAEAAAYVHLPHLLLAPASIKHACASGANERVHYLDLA